MPEQDDDQDPKDQDPGREDPKDDGQEEDPKDDADEEEPDEAKLPAWAQKELKRARSEAAKHRRGAKTAEQEALAKFAKALGLDSGEKDPEKLAKDLESERSAARQAKAELTIVRRAGAAGADPDALLDSRTFMAGVADLDPADSDYAAQVDAAIRTAVKENPRLKGGQAPQGKGGGEFGGGSGGSEKDKKNMSMDDVYKMVRGQRN